MSPSQKLGRHLGLIAIPQGVEYASIVPDPQHPIGRGDPVGVGLLGVPEEGVGDPDLAHHVAVQAKHLHGAVEFQPPVIPGLGKEDVDGVLLFDRETEQPPVTAKNHKKKENTFGRVFREETERE